MNPRIFLVSFFALASFASSGAFAKAVAAPNLTQAQIQAQTAAPSKGGIEFPAERPPSEVKDCAVDLVAGQYIDSLTLAASYCRDSSQGVIDCTKYEVDSKITGFGDAIGDCTTKLGR